MVFSDFSAPASSVGDMSISLEFREIRKSVDTKVVSTKYESRI